jgi:hypothetical protein
MTWCTACSGCSADRLVLRLCALPLRGSSYAACPRCFTSMSAALAASNGIELLRVSCSKCATVSRLDELQFKYRLKVRVHGGGTATVAVAGRCAFQRSRGGVICCSRLLPAASSVRDDRGRRHALRRGGRVTAGRASLADEERVARQVPESASAAGRAARRTARVLFFPTSSSQAQRRQASAVHGRLLLTPRSCTTEGSDACCYMYRYMCFSAT